MPKPLKASVKAKLPAGPGIDAQRVQFSVRTQFNPLPNLTPVLLGTYLESFRLGFLRNAALTWQAMEERDYTLASVAPKRRKDAARFGFEILALDDSPEAQAQKEKLEYFYNNLTATTALMGNEKGGAGLLFRQMMDAVGKLFAIHEIIYEPTPDGNLTATFKFCPLWWFENTTGKLRYLQSEFDVYGVDMQDYEWLVTVGDGIMRACSVCYIFKGLSLKDWVAFNEKMGTPTVVGETTAAKGSQEWDALVDAVTNIGQDFGAVVNAGAKISYLESKTTGQMQFEPLVDKMDRGMVTLWRGGDLGTSSNKDATGSNRQEGETQILQADDGQMLSETLTQGVSRFVLKYFFGDAPQLAYIKVKTAEQKNLDQDIKIDEFLLGAGFGLSKQYASENYSRPLPKPDDDLLTAPAAPVIPEPKPNTGGNPTLANEAPTAEFEDASTDAIIQSLLTDFQPLNDRLAAISRITDPTLQRQKLAQFLKDLDQVSLDMNHDPETARTLQNILAAGLANGLATKPKSATMANGDVPGHEFHGNQWQEGASYQEAKAASDKATKLTEGADSRQSHKLAQASHYDAARAHLNAAGEAMKQGNVAAANFHAKAGSIHMDLASHETRMLKFSSDIRRVERSHAAGQITTGQREEQIQKIHSSMASSKPKVTS